jgi:hypothetical protein
LTIKEKPLAISGEVIRLLTKSQWQLGQEGGLLRRTQQRHDVVGLDPLQSGRGVLIDIGPHILRTRRRRFKAGAKWGHRDGVGTGMRWVVEKTVQGSVFGDVVSQAVEINLQHGKAGLDDGSIDGLVKGVGQVARHNGFRLAGIGIDQIAGAGIFQGLQGWKHSFSGEPH